MSELLTVRFVGRLMLALLRARKNSALGRGKKVTKIVMRKDALDLLMAHLDTEEKIVTTRTFPADDPPSVLNYDGMPIYEGEPSLGEWYEMTTETV